MTPSTAARRLLCSWVLGAALGLYYGFLRPLRPRRTFLADGLFLLGGVWTWVYLSFGICGGDLRLGYLGAMVSGVFLFDRTAGRLLCPLFSGFWKLCGKFCRKLLVPWKKFLVFSVNLFPH